ncbi:prolyl-tRNA synthetase [candidate division WWE3 bacterium RIFCSPLOWO2_12_FULL_36_10]|uniref:Proline--tRNA ligase n=1 Tax=candidate division WWE3 bacterium RIFCSPLOWO2_12_FULL_36_10 TaxID=1802630 RepID=A0A1F4VJ48_UNCKA|nr:MAG: prolyl-tRNA synthetase [candidate division WWE3 bacterium RIFCSPLOWO2_12_FULL_36_10]
MLYSKLIGKTKKQFPKDEESLNAQLLIKAGFIQKEMAGVYVFLPLGLHVLNNIINIVREEMNNIDGQEILLSALQNPEVWKKSGRWDNETLDVWFKTQLKNGSELGLGTTHEEPLANLLSERIQSYKDLPLYVYQFQTKFRNETRARSGLIRTREFIMKDLYSFNKTNEELDEFYETAKDSYVKIFERAGIGDKTFLTFASGGSFSKYSHEFQTICTAGEDTIYLDRNKKIAINKEVYTDEVIKDLGLKKEDLEEVSAVEVGNIFKQGTRFSEPLGLKFTDENGVEKPVVMGAYGIGPSRLMATIVEINHDDKGIIWPKSVSPFNAHLVSLNTQADGVYEKLNSAGIEVLFDDRENVTAGEKLSDADLIGITNRIIVSKNTGDGVELKSRDSD